MKPAVAGLFMIAVLLLVFVVFPDGTSENPIVRGAWRFRQLVLIVGLVLIAGAAAVAFVRGKQPR